MASVICYDARPDLDCVRISNSSMSVFVGVIALAASALAATDRQREFAAWVSAHDQNLLGVGMVSFDVSCLPWSHETFTADREFVLKAIAAAKARTGWERLGYEPLEIWLQPCLDQFRMLIEAFVIQDACGDKTREWPLGQPDALVLCPVHQIYLHAHGCVLCHDG